MYASGGPGTNSGYIFPSTYTGRAGNAFTAPDTDHILYGGDATAKANVDATDIMTVGLIEKACVKASTMGGDSTDLVQLQPIMVEGEEHYVCVMHDYQAYDLRTAAGAANWLEIQKAAAAAEGRNNPIFKGSLGMHNGAILHKHRNTITFNDYGAGGNVDAARALFLGEQAMVCAFGSPGNNLRFDWHEETADRGDKLVITTATICGIKKTTFNSKDYGVISLDTAATDPTA